MLNRNPSDRKALELRPVAIEPGINRYAEGSVLIKAGNTHVLCTASLEDHVPNWLLGKGRGWVTAEYSMLPRATHTRSKRDREKVSGRTHEIQRLIGRALRSVVDLEALGERSIVVDCDVIQADGGTRTASITGGFVALLLALHKMIQQDKIPGKSLRDICIDTVSGISVGLLSVDGKEEVFVDLDYQEDANCEVDMNFVIRGSGLFVEVQGTAEGQAFSNQELNKMIAAAQVAAQQLSELQRTVLKACGVNF